MSVYFLYLSGCLNIKTCDMNESEAKNRIAESRQRIKELRTKKIDPDYRKFLIAMNQLQIKSNRQLIKIDSLLSFGKIELQKRKPGTPE